MREHNLIDYKALQSKEKRKPKDERELLARLRVFARYQSPQEHEQFVQGVLEAKRLRKRIEQLQQYRRLGIRTQAEAMAYEAEKRRREQEQQMRRQRDSASYLYDARPAGTGGKDRSSRYKKRQRDASDVDGACVGRCGVVWCDVTGWVGGRDCEEGQRSPHLTDCMYTIFPPPPTNLGLT